MYCSVIIACVLGDLKKKKKIKSKAEEEAEEKNENRSYFHVFVRFLKFLCLSTFWFCMCYLSGEGKAETRKRFWLAESLCQPNSL